MSSFFRCAHISDLHFSKPTWSPAQFFSKRWLGNLNLLFARRHVYRPDQLYSLIPLFKELNVSTVFITGDLTTTSWKKEFDLAKDFIAALKNANMKVFAIPGNHDQYTKEAHRTGLFYRFFDASFSPSSLFNLKTDSLTAYPLSEKWWLIALDTAIATSLISSRGCFSEILEKKLEQLLLQIPRHHRVILMNHFPFFQNDSPRKTLERGSQLKKLMQRFPSIALYLHGHTHRHCIADLRASGFPIILDSGSTAHKERGSWNLIDCFASKVEIAAYQLTNDPLSGQSGEWKSVSHQSFKW